MELERKGREAALSAASQIPSYATGRTFVAFGPFWP